MVNFRNYASASFSPGSDKNVIIGENGQGKTNLLEAISVVALGKSFKTHSLKEAIRFGQEASYLKADFFLKDYDHRMEIEFSETGRSYQRDQNPRKSLADYKRGFSMVVFQPEDLDMVRLSPGKRRAFLNDALSSVSFSYEENLKNYRHLVRQRNYALKNLRSDRQLIKIYNLQLAKIGSEILYERLKGIKKLASWAREEYQKISNGGEDLKVHYLSSLPFDQDFQVQSEIYLQKLEESYEKDLVQKRTSLGPHVDDLRFLLDGREAKAYGSQGQQRSIVLSLKLAEVRFIWERLGIRPLVILDDVFSELDQHRRKRLFKQIEGMQTFISLTEADYHLRDLLEEEDLSSFEIRGNQINHVS